MNRMPPGFDVELEAKIGALIERHEGFMAMHRAFVPVFQANSSCCLAPVLVLAINGLLEAITAGDKPDEAGPIGELLVLIGSKYAPNVVLTPTTLQ